jgi:hypothetical protein
MTLVVTTTEQVTDVTTVDDVTTVAITESVSTISEQVAGVQGAQGLKGDTGATGLGYGLTTSSSSNAIGTGNKTFTVNDAGAYVSGDRVRVSASSNPTYFVEGVIVVKVGLSLTISVDTTNGTGTFTSWNFGIAGVVGATGATGAMGISYAQLLTSATTGSGTTLTAIYPSGSSAIALEANTAYFFEAFLSLTKAASATSGNWRIGLGFSNLQQSLHYQATLTSNSATAAAIQASTNSTSASLDLGTAGTNSVTGLIRYSGFFKSNATTGGTLTPQFAQSATPSSGNPTANSTSYFRLVPYSTNYPIISGNWS